MKTFRVVFADGSSVMVQANSQWEAKNKAKPMGRTVPVMAHEIKMNPRQLIRWKKVPSVTGGGKKYFYTAPTSKGRVWIAWDRILLKWGMYIEGKRDPIFTFNTPEAGKKFVVQWLSSANPNMMRSPKRLREIVTLKEVKDIAKRKGISLQKSLGIARRKNPPSGAVKIYDDIEAIEAKKGKSSLWPGEKFRHDFKRSKGRASIYGLPDGSLLIKGKKRLWKNFNYSEKDI